MRSRVCEFPISGLLNITVPRNNHLPFTTPTCPDPMKPRPSSTPSTRPCKKSPTAESRHTATLPPSWELVRKSQPSTKTPRLTRQTSPAPAPSRRLSQAFARRRLAALQPRHRAMAARHQRQRHHLTQVCLLFFPSPRAGRSTLTLQVSTRGQSEPGRCAAGRGR